ncbi:Uncharacterised protein [Mycobacteroides abscessus]|nr:Uncharacterised protein [Mycobacteroides abscessus]
MSAGWVVSSGCASSPVPRLPAVPSLPRSTVSAVSRW